MPNYDGAQNHFIVLVAFMRSSEKKSENTYTSANKHFINL